MARRWRLLSGENEWQGLLDPLDIDLRRYIIHCGDMVQAVVDAFIEETKSNNIGLPRYSKKNFFSKIGLDTGNPYKYIVKKYFYGSTFGSVSNEPTGSAGNSNWLGFVAVATDEGKQVLGRRDILISWRGTLRKSEINIDVNMVDLVSASDILGQVNEPKVHRGWFTFYTSSESGSKYNSTSCRDQILAAVRELMKQYKQEEMSITVTGHSMGAALAILNATDIVYNGHNKLSEQPNKACLVTAIVFACPRLGNQGFGKVFSSLENLHVLRVRNKHDIVPDLPPPIFYIHVGKELVFDARESPYLKDPSKMDHELQVYLHGVAGTQGENGGFKLEVSRDLALINKRLDGLKDEYLVVANWWIERNKSMVQNKDGNWILFDRETDSD